MYVPPSGSNNRKPLVPLVAGAGAALLTIAVGAHFFFMPARSATAPPSSVVAQSPHDLLECLVCGKAVDPDTTPYKLDFRGQRIFFDRQECLNSFVADPNRYGHLKMDVRWKEVDPSTSPAGLPDVPSPSPSASSSTDDTAAPPAESETATGDTAATPAETETATPETPQDTGTETNSETPSGDDATRDPNPPPMHLAPRHHHHHHQDGGGDTSTSLPDVPQPPADGGSASPAQSGKGGDDDVPPPPSGQ